MFEGQVVEACVMKVSGSTPVEDGDEIVVSVDDIIQLVGEFRVTSVRHYCDEKTGKLVREQVLKVSKDGGVRRMPFNPTDPDDDGVIRNPRVVSGS
jgi:hypothetical protein